MEIVDAVTAGDVAQVRDLFQEYWSSFGFTPCFQGFEGELAALPGAYSAPGGALGLLRVEGRGAGCVALRRFDDTRGEFKRLYVRPEFRGLGAGRRLMEWVLDRARQIGYTQVVADTMPQMTEALAMYERAGFQRTGPYGEHPTPGAIYLARNLSSIST
jgi:putative acetyltransferase